MNYLGPFKLQGRKPTESSLSHKEEFIDPYEWEGQGK